MKEIEVVENDGDLGAPASGTGSHPLDQAAAHLGSSSVDPSRQEWCARFVQHMLDRAAPRDHFDDGGLILDYAEATAPTYWETDWQRDMGPEECADADISYWGEE